MDQPGAPRSTPAAPLVSGEGVGLELPTAGVASRMIAVAIDLVVQGVAFLVLLLVVAIATLGADSDGVAAVLIVLLILDFAGYPIICEWLGHGRTLGKVAMGLRVVRDDGGPVGFRHALIRGLAGLVLEKPGLVAPLGTFAGMATVASSEREKRIGDLMAGTIVINERAAPQPTATPVMWVPDWLVPWGLSLDLSGLDRHLAHTVRTFVSRAYAMSDAGRHDLGEQLRARVLAVVTPAPPPGVPTPLLLQTVLAERRRRSEPQPAGSPVPPWNVQAWNAQPWGPPQAAPPWGTPPPTTQPWGAPPQASPPRTWGPGSDQAPNGGAGSGGFSPPA